MTPPPHGTAVTRTAEEERADVVAYIRSVSTLHSFPAEIERGEHVGAAKESV